MHTNKTLKHFLFTAISFLPLLYLYMVYSQLPESVPTHFGANGEANGFTQKSGMWMLIGGMCLLTVFMYFLMQFLNRVDPKRVNKIPHPIFNKMAVAIVIFLTALNIIIIISGVHPEQKLAEKAMMPLMGLLFIFLGNYMFNIKPNYFAGIRVPWTLASDYNWKKTHQVGGRVWFYGGILLTVCSFITTPQAMSILFPVILGIMVVIPIGYSFMIFKNESKQPGYFDKE